MRVRTLITQRLYFGVDALHLRAATGRVVARVVGLPPERARVSARNLCQDFGFDALRGQALIDDLLAEGLLEAPDELQADYRPDRAFPRVRRGAGGRAVAAGARQAAAAPGLRAGARKSMRSGRTIRSKSRRMRRSAAI